MRFNAINQQYLSTELSVFKKYKFIAFNSIRKWTKGQSNNLRIYILGFFQMGTKRDELFAQFYEIFQHYHLFRKTEL